MNDEEFTGYKEDNMWIGWLNKYPDYWTQGRSLEELKKNLVSLADDIESFRDVLSPESPH